MRIYLSERCHRERVVRFFVHTNPGGKMKMEAYQITYGFDYWRKIFHENSVNFNNYNAFMSYFDKLLKIVNKLPKKEMADWLTKPCALRG